tara:strand:- start:13 stop:351 length:339 start_codon:yes stop_codon:yes gene_type:complete
MYTYLKIYGEKIKIIKLEGHKCEVTGRCDYKVIIYDQTGKQTFLGTVGSGWFRNGGWGWCAHSKYVRPHGSTTREQCIRNLVRKYFEFIGDKPAIWKTEANSKIKTSYDLGR